MTLVTPVGTVNVPLVVNVWVVAADAGVANPTVSAREPTTPAIATVARAARERGAFERGRPPLIR
ncbi:hypothetical protein [Streptomyces sp. NPDC001985]|uniref:hypothetical protein n=1 Tax=Streptomyces sp. NPDC001985 TaxID=3154406 RepID=UPI00331FA0F6